MSIELKDWIDISERRPSHGQLVIVAMQDDEVRPATYDSRHGFSDDGYLEPTHWMGMPISPSDLRYNEAQEKEYELARREIERMEKPE